MLTCRISIKAVDGNMKLLKGKIFRPPLNTPYKWGNFTLEINMPYKYLFDLPSLRFFSLKYRIPTSIQFLGKYTLVMIQTLLWRWSEIEWIGASFIQSRIWWSGGENVSVDKRSKPVTLSQVRWDRYRSFSPNEKDKLMMSDGQYVFVNYAVVSTCDCTGFVLCDFFYATIDWLWDAMTTVSCNTKIMIQKIIT